MDWVIAIALTGWVVLQALCALRGWRLVGRFHSLDNTIAISSAPSGSPLSEPFFSIVVCGRGATARIEERLSNNWINYELIVVCDLDNEPDSAELLRRYAMVRIPFADSNADFSYSGSVLYRSRMVLYRRLSIVDHRPSTFEECCDVALSVARYDNMLFMDRSVMLQTNALAQFNRALCQNGRRLPVAAVVLSNCTTDSSSAIDSMFRFLFYAGGLVRCGNSISSVGSITLFDRSWLVGRGGAESVVSMSDSEVLLGFVAAVAQDEWNALTLGGNRRRCFDRSVNAVLWSAMAVWSTAAVVVGEWNFYVALAVWLTTLYLATLSMTAFALAVSGSVEPFVSHFRIVPSTLFTLFCYPFCRFRYIIRR